MEKKEAVKKVIGMLSHRVTDTKLTDHEFDTAVTVVEELVMGETHNAERILINMLGWRDEAQILGAVNDTIYDYEGSEEYKNA